MFRSLSVRDVKRRGRAPPGLLREARVVRVQLGRAQHQPEEHWPGVPGLLPLGDEDAAGDRDELSLLELADPDDQLIWVNELQVGLDLDQLVAGGVRTTR